MSKYAESVDFSQSEKSEIEDKQDKLRFIERQFQWHGEDWHFQLAKHIDEPIKVYSWFKDAKKVGDKIYFNGASQSGSKAYYWVKDHYIGNLLAAFGKVEIILAKNGNVVSYFNPYEKFKKNAAIDKILENVT